MRVYIYIYIYICICTHRPRISRFLPRELGVKDIKRSQACNSPSLRGNKSHTRTHNSENPLESTYLFPPEKFQGMDHEGKSLRAFRGVDFWHADLLARRLSMAASAGRENIISLDSSCHWLPDGVGTDGVVAEVPQFTLMNFHGEMYAKCGRSSQPRLEAGELEAPPERFACDDGRVYLISWPDKAPNLNCWPIIIMIIIIIITITIIHTILLIPIIMMIIMLVG